MRYPLIIFHIFLLILIPLISQKMVVVVVAWSNDDGDGSSDRIVMTMFKNPY